MTVLAGFVLAIWLLSPILPPFVVGMAIAYLLDPVVGRMERRGVSRAVAAGTLVLGGYALGILALVLVAPIVFEQVAALATKLPAYARSAYNIAAPFLARAATLVGAATPVDVTQSLGGTIEKVMGVVAGFAGGILGRSFAMLSVVLLLAITPLVTFYLLRDWPRVLAEVDGWLPREHAATIHAQAREIDRVLAGFARGTAIVCLFLAAFYSLALSAAGLEFGLVIGLVAGAVSFVPYVGTAVGLTSSVGVAIFQFWPSWPRIAVVFAVFVVGQILSDYVLTPRLVGERVGLHPLWVMFGVLAGGTLFGFVGMLIAVPVCAVIGVLARFGLERYKASPLYRGGDPEAD